MTDCRHRQSYRCGHRWWCQLALIVIGPLFLSACASNHGDTVEVGRASMQAGSDFRPGTHVYHFSGEYSGINGNKRWSVAKAESSGAIDDTPFLCSIDLSTRTRQHHVDAAVFCDYLNRIAIILVERQQHWIRQSDESNDGREISPRTPVAYVVRLPEEPPTFAEDNGLQWVLSVITHIVAEDHAVLFAPIEGTVSFQSDADGVVQSIDIDGKSQGEIAVAINGHFTAAKQSDRHWLFRLKFPYRR